jgi:hypothetical protein
MVRAIKLRKMAWVAQVALMREVRNAQSNFNDETLKGQYRFWRIGL